MHVKYLGKGLGEKGLPAAGGADQEDVALLELDLVDLAAGVDALVVVVDGDGEDLLGALLSDHVLVQELDDPLWRRHLGERRPGLLGRRLLFVDYLPAQLDALVTDVHRAGAGDKPSDVLLTFSTERAVVLTARAPRRCHSPLPPS
jgi:hypothetical protein